MANPWRGEVATVLNGEPHSLRLTLGALAELEATLGTDTLLALVERFETAAFTTRDVLALLLAGLRGGGWRGTQGDLLTAEIEGGPIEAARAAARALALAFSTENAG